MEHDISPEQAAERIGRPETQLIDVRTPEEWEQGIIAGARHVELGELTAQAATIDRERPIVFYCRSGARSGMATEAFRGAGYEAFNLAGGIEAWAGSGRPVSAPRR